MSDPDRAAPHVDQATLDRLPWALREIQERAEHGDSAASCVLTCLQGMSVLLIRSEAAEQQVADLQRAHTAEGTFPCTCGSYPHSPNCGLDARLVALREQVDALTKERDELLSRVDDVPSEPSLGSTASENEVTPK